MLRVAAGADALDALSLLLRLDFFSDAFSSSAAFSVGRFELSGGVEGFDDDRRRWWLGRKGCCAVLIAARLTAQDGAAVIALVERKALPSAGENMASGGGVLVVVLMVDWLAAAQSAAGVTLCAREPGPSFPRGGRLRESTRYQCMLPHDDNSTQKSTISWLAAILPFGC